MLCLMTYFRMEIGLEYSFDSSHGKPSRAHLCVRTGALFYSGAPRHSALISFTVWSRGPPSLWALFVYYSGIKGPTVQPCSALPQSSSCISSPQHHCDGQAASGVKKERKHEKMQRGEKGEDKKRETEYNEEWKSINNRRSKDDKDVDCKSREK